VEIKLKRKFLDDRKLEKMSSGLWGKSLGFSEVGKLSRG